MLIADACIPVSDRVCVCVAAQRFSHSNRAPDDGFLSWVPALQSHCALCRALWICLSHGLPRLRCPFWVTSGELAPTTKPPLPPGPHLCPLTSHSHALLDTATPQDQPPFKGFQGPVYKYRCICLPSWFCGPGSSSISCGPEAQPHCGRDRVIHPSLGHAPSPLGQCHGASG